MTPEQFVIWLRGFTEGVHEFNVSPKQWDTLKDKLAEVKDKPTPSFPISDPNTFPRWQEPHYQYPSDINKVTCEDLNGVISGGSSTQSIVTDGFIQNSSYTRANPPSTLTYTTNKNVVYTMKDK